MLVVVGYISGGGGSHDNRPDKWLFPIVKEISHS